jgi:exopolysaccharide biosynthesis polyprenyl glycosylphosphotransferase
MRPGVEESALALMLIMSLQRPAPTMPLSPSTPEDSAAAAPPPLVRTRLERTRRAAVVGTPTRINWHFALDAAMLLLAAGVSIASAPAAGVSTDVIALAAFSLVVLAVLTYAGIYQPTFAPHFLDDARSILGATAIAAMAMTFLRVLVFDNPQAAEQAARAWVFASTYMIAARGGVQLFELRRRRLGLGGQPTLIVGAGMVGRRFAMRLIERPEFGLKPVGFLDDDPLQIESPEASSVPVFSSGGAAQQGPADLFGPGLEQVIREHQVSHVVVGFSPSSHQAELDLLRRCQDMGVRVSVLPRLFESVTDQTGLERLGGIPLLSVHPTDPAGWQYAIKYGGDRIIAMLAIVVLWPLLLGATLATLISLGRPIIFKQARVGLDGREFSLYKFRTMRLPRPGEAEEANLDDRLALGLAPGGVEGKDRRSAVGSFLRRSSIDELPQLFNVVRGDMALVGPRPERPNFVSLFDESVYRYADRHRVKSGITGWAQVHGLRGDTSIADRAEWDNYYIENRSFWLDLKIIVLTLPALLRDRGE